MELEGLNKFWFQDENSISYLDDSLLWDIDLNLNIDDQWFSKMLNSMGDFRESKKVILKELSNILNIYLIANIVCFQLNNLLTVIICYKCVLIFYH